MLDICDQFGKQLNQQFDQLEINKNKSEQSHTRRIWPDASNVNHFASAFDHFVWIGL